MQSLCDLSKFHFTSISFNFESFLTFAFFLIKIHKRHFLLVVYDSIKSNRKSILKKKNNESHLLFYSTSSIRKLSL